MSSLRAAALHAHRLGLEARESFDEVPDGRGPRHPPQRSMPDQPGALPAARRPCYVIIEFEFHGATEARSFLERLEEVWRAPELSPTLARPAGSSRGSSRRPRWSSRWNVEAID